ncbi:MAG TPA: RDD family protein [Methanocella sp.]|nr:RDD family protein [Methanocella sp.]
MNSINYYNPHEGDFERELFEHDYYEYAGFLIRSLANLIDGAIMFVIMLAITIPAFMLIGIGFAPMGIAGSRNDGFSLSLLLAMGLWALLIIIVWWLYHALFESSGYMGTPGKLIFGLTVTDDDYEQISFARATLRYFLMGLTNTILSMGSIAILFTVKKQGLYDILAGTVVVKKL